MDVEAVRARRAEGERFRPIYEIADGEITGSRPADTELTVVKFVKRRGQSVAVSLPRVPTIDGHFAGIA